MMQFTPFQIRFMTWNRSLSPQIILHALAISISSLGAETPLLAQKDSPILTSCHDRSLMPPPMNLAAQVPANGGGCNKVSFPAYFPQLEHGAGRASVKVKVMSLKIMIVTSMKATLRVVVMLTIFGPSCYDKLCRLLRLHRLAHQALH
jgi:hypothetical protein